MKEIATKLLILLGDEAGPLAPLFQFSHLRFKDRDDLEVVFKFWRDDAKKVYEIDKLWDARLRRLYGVRYDVRDNIVDWDYHMKLIKEVSIIHKTEFFRWRQHGLVYEVRDSAYDKPNRTTATVDIMKQEGVSVTKWGYFNDVITGPFISFGIETENKELVEKTNDQHTHASSEVSEHNVHAYMQEYKKTFPILESLLSRVNIHLLPPSADPFLAFQKQTRGGKKPLQFHAIFLGNGNAQYLQKIPPSFVSSATQVFVETARYMLDLKAEQVTAFQNKILEIGKSSGFHPLKKYNDKHVDVVVLQADGLESVAGNTIVSL
ncbi:UNVERIFIED_CONTAM: Dynein assembly factor 3, axonemal [Siphonaria sp. JEL0065]|nr:Dynein assembly factor 3, axonemal [Siphonaria sp. JEL0065]